MYDENSRMIKETKEITEMMKSIHHESVNNLEKKQLNLF